MSILKKANNAISAFNNLPGTLVPALSSRSSVFLSSFLDRRMPDGTRWNKVYPYVLKVVSAKNSTQSKKTLSNLSGIVSASGRFSLDGQDSLFEVALPITPSQISVSIPSASEISVLLNGILEEHNGAPLRFISISGTTGVAPFRLSQYGESPIKSIFGSELLGRVASDLFANTIRGVQDFVAEAKGRSQEKLLDSSLLTSPQNPASNEVLQMEQKIEDTFNSGIYGTGYWHFHKLHKFIDKYLQNKKQKQNKDQYLVFEMQKDELYYLCSLRDFSFQKKPGTLEYDYKIELVAWDYYDRTSFGSSFSAVAGKVNRLTQALNTIQRARKIIARAKQIYRGLEQDVDNILAVSRAMAILVKDAIGVAHSISDFPNSIAKNFQASVLNEWRNLDTSAKSLLPASIVSAMSVAAVTFEQRSDRTVSGRYSIVNSLSSVNDLFNNPDDYLDFFDAISIDSIPVNNDLQDQIDQEIDRVRNLDTSYFKIQKKNLMASAAVMSAKFGVGNATFNRIYNIKIKNENTQGLKSGQLELLQSINDLITALNTIIVTKKSSDRSIQNYVEFYTDVAAQNQIALQNPAGKFAVPFPAGATMESLAAQYLGDANRWPEIAALNQLRAPYIDEDGFKKPIKGPTSGFVITLSNSKNIYINQPVIIKNAFDPPVNARILKIETIDNQTVLVTLNKDVTGYSGEKQSYLQGFLPGTINSTSVVYIPSAAPSQLSSDDFRIAPSIKDQQVLNIISQSDLLLTSSGDLAVSSGGDYKIATGMANLVQAAVLKLRTPRGSLVSYPNFGLGVSVGANTNDIDVNIINQSLSAAFASDPRFSGVLASKIRKIGPALDISVALALPQTGLILPINTQIRP
jgi:hypothetical protein